MLLLLLRNSNNFDRVTTAGETRVVVGGTVDGQKRIYDREAFEGNDLAWTEGADTVSITAAVVPKIDASFTETDDDETITLNATQHATLNPATITPPEPEFGGVPAQAAISPPTIDTYPFFSPLIIDADGDTTVNVGTLFTEKPLFDDPTNTTTDGATSSRLELVIDLDMGLTAQNESHELLDTMAARVPPDTEPLPWKVVVLTPGGTKLATMDNAALTGVDWSLNAPGFVTFEVPIFDPKITHLKTAEREVQVWWGPTLMWWGVVVRSTVSKDAVSFQAVELPWYFTRRVVGDAEENFINNGSFEFGSDFWYLNQFAPSEPNDNKSVSNWSQTITEERSISGSKCLKMWSNNNLIYGTQARQFFNWTPNPSEVPDGEEWAIVAWCYVPSSDYVGPRVQEYNWDGDMAPFGIGVQRISTTETVVRQTPNGPGVFGKIIEDFMIGIDDDTPKDTWIRIEAPFTQEVTGQTESINVVLYCPNGTVFWDEISLVRNERLFFNNVDQATIIKELVEHSQDTNYGKSDLAIATDCPPTGVPRTRSYYFFNHELISDTIDEWPQLFDGMDWNIEITQDSRTFTSFYPQRGTEKMRYPLVLGKNISQVSLSVDGEQTANKVIVMADGGQGAAREEAITVDDDALEDGLILETVYNATPGSTINTLQAQANRGVVRYRDPVIIPEITCYQQETDRLLGKLFCGDIVPVYVQRGWVELNGMYRIVGISVNPYTNEMTFTLNPYANWDIRGFIDAG